MGVSCIAHRRPRLVPCCASAANSNSIFEKLPRSLMRRRRGTSSCARLSFRDFYTRDKSEYAHIEPIEAFRRSPQAPSAFDLQCPEPSHCHHFNRVYTGVDGASFPPGGVIQRPRKIHFFSSSPTSPHTSCVDVHGARVVRRLLGPRRLTMRERTWRPSGSPVWAPAP